MRSVAIPDELGMFDESQVYEAEIQHLVQHVQLRRELEETLKSVVI